MKKNMPALTGLILLVFILTIPTFFIRCVKTAKANDNSVLKTAASADALSCVDLQSGLVLYFPFNNNLADSSGNNHTGIVNGTISYTTDKNNNANGAVLFNGNSYISVQDPGDLSPSTAVTVAAQFYTTSTAQQGMLGKLNYSNANSIIWSASLFGSGSLYPTSASFAVVKDSIACGQFEGIGNQDLVYSVVPIQANTWYHIACVFDNGVEKIYLNGKLHHAITRNFTSLKQCTDASIILGAWYRYSTFFFNGKMDEFRMYNRALNDVEIAQLASGF